MGEVTLRQTTAALLADPLFGEGDVDSKILRLLVGEYQRHLAEHRAVDARLAQKYQTTFADFLDRRTTVQHESSWEVEKDALDWETAVAGISELAAKCKELEDLTNDAG